jgi:two-component system, LuxR family, secretion system response regulator SsrB
MSIQKILGKKSPYVKMLGRAKHAADFDASVPGRLKTEMTGLLTDSFLPCAVYIFDYKNSEYQYMSRSIEHITGLDADMYYFRGKEHHLQCMHPDDRKYYTHDATKAMLQKLRHVKKEEAHRYFLSVSYRYCRADGQYIHLLQQFRIVQCSVTGVPLLAAGILTDISMLKHDGNVRLQISHRRKMTFTSNQFAFGNAKNSLLSRKQHEVLRLALEGKSLKETGAILNISWKTVKSHRQRILKTLKAKNMYEAGKKAGY